MGFCNLYQVGACPLFAIARLQAESLEAGASAPGQLAVAADCVEVGSLNTSLPLPKSEPVSKRLRQAGGHPKFLAAASASDKPPPTAGLVADSLLSPRSDSSSGRGRLSTDADEHVEAGGQRVRKLLRRHDSDADGASACGFNFVLLWLSCAWWVSSIHTWVGPYLEVLSRRNGGLLRKLLIFSVCSGSCAEGLACLAIGLPVLLQICFFESSSQMAKYYVGVVKPFILHAFKSMDLACVQRGLFIGECWTHGNAPNCVFQFDYQHDCMFGGALCIPFTCLRVNQEAVPPAEHAQFQALFGFDVGSYVQTVRVQCPLGGILEEVPDLERLVTVGGPRT